MKKQSRWMAFLLCGVMAVGVGASQMLPTIAKPECSCKVEVHGSNCPLSKCTCGREEHAEGCTLYGAAKELTTCICEPDVHAEGCPRYVAVEDEGMEKTEPETPQASDEILTQAPEGAEEPEGTPLPEEQPDATPEVSKPSETPQPEEQPDFAPETSKPVETPEGTESPETPSVTPETPDHAETGSVQQPQEETIRLTYRFAEETEGTLSFEQIEIPTGEAIGAHIPEISLSEGFAVESYEIDGTIYDANALAAYCPKQATEILIHTKPLEAEELPEGEDGSGHDAAYWESAPGWAGEERIQGSLLTVAEIREMDVQLKKQVDEIKGVLGVKGNVALKEDQDNMTEILALYAVTHGQMENFPNGVKVTSEQEINELRSIYWCMTQITGVSNTKGTAVQVKRLSIAEGAKILGLDNSQVKQAQSLVTESVQESVSEMVDNSILNRLTDEELAEITGNIPTSLSTERRAVLMAALSLEGKVKYFWGGKSASVGWNPYWGESYTVTSPGSSQTGTTRAYGMDCSGFVSWAFINAEGSKDVYPYIGEGSANQYRNSKAIAWEDAQPGDLVFYKNPVESGINHVGIVVSVDENGPKTVVHCSSSKNSVVVTNASGFQYARTPYVYGE